MYSCTECEKHFATPHYLRQHMNAVSTSALNVESVLEATRT